MKPLLIVTAALGLAACASAPKTADRTPPATPVVAPAPAAPVPAIANTPKASPYAPAQEDPSTRGDYVAGGLYKPGVADSTPDYVPDVDAIPEPVITDIPRSKVGNRSSYTVLGKTYKVLDTSRGYVEQGLASYYGQKFHGRRTSNLEVYDMYAFTAAHKTLPLPSFARVTNLDTGKSIVVRVNDRGPFHEGRIIDLSYAAAVKLGITKQGVGRVEVRAVHPDDPGTLIAGTSGKGKKAMGGVSTAPSVVRSALDRLVAVIPGRKARATADAAAPAIVEVPATGVALPAAMSGAGVAVNAAAAASGTATAPNATPAAPGDARFDMRQDGRAMSADEFDAWMKSRRIRVATGKPATPGPTTSTAPTGSSAVAPIPEVAAPVAAATSVDTASAITLQVASFGTRTNADRALAMLQGAGIDGARLQDGVANGQPVWRLRIGPVASSGEAELAARLEGLGFGAPRRVHD
jgi:rare lipoprotein A